MSSVRQSRLLACGLTILLATLTCRDANEPTIAHEVALSAVIHPMSVVADTSGWPFAECNIHIQVIARGKDVTLGALTFGFFIGPSRNTPLAAAILSAADVGSAFGVTTVPVGDTATAAFALTAGVPFETQVTLEFDTNSVSNTTHTARYVCGPPRPASPPSPPALTQFSFTPSGAPVTGGDTLRVTYSATGSKLWATELTFSGAFTATSAWFEAQAGQSSASFARAVPASASQGEKVYATLITWDEWGQFASATDNTGAVIDTVPPTVSVTAASRCCGALATSLRGNYYSKDSIVIAIQAADNLKLKKVVWEVLPGVVRDSVMNPGKSWAGTKVLAAADAWLSGSGQEVRVTVWDSAGLSSNATVPRDTNFRVYPTVNRPIFKKPGLELDGPVIIDSARGRIFKIGSGPIGDRLYAVDLATLNTIFWVSLGAANMALDMTASGDTLVVLQRFARKVVLVDVRGATPVLTKLDLTVPTTPWDPMSVAVTANGKALIGIHRGISAGPVMLDLATGTQTVRADAFQSVADFVAVASPERDIIVYQGPGCTQIYDSATDTFSACKAVPEGVPSMSRTPRLFAIAGSIYDGDFNFLRKMPLESGLGFAAFGELSRDGQYFYKSGFERGLFRIRVSDGQLLDRTPVNVGHPVTILPDGTHVFFDGFSSLSLMDVRDASILPTPTVVANASAKANAEPTSAATSSPAAKAPAVRASRMTGRARAIPIPR